MTLEQATKLKEGQKIWYRGFEELPEEVEVLILKTDSYGKLEIHLVDNCYIPERDLDYIFLTFDECAKVCEEYHKKKLEQLREMIKLGR